MPKQDDVLKRAAHWQRQRNYKEAVNLYSAWLNKVPRSTKSKRVRDVAYSLGVLNEHLGDAGAALTWFERALEADVAMWQAALGLGRVYGALGRPVLAVWTLQEALDRIRVQPNNQKGLLALLNALAELLEVNEPLRALGLFEESLSIDVQQTAVVERYLALRRRQCVWPVIPQWLVDACPGQDLVLHLGPEMVLYEDRSAVEKAQVVKHFLHQETKLVYAPAYGVGGAESGRIRLAYVVNDRMDAELGEWLLSQLQLHDRRVFDVYGLHNASGPLSRVGRELLQCVDLHVPISHLTDDQVASRLRELKVEVLINPMGVCRGARWGVYAHQAAPVQLVYGDRLGSTYVTGATHVLVDQIQEHAFSEPSFYPSALHVLRVKSLHAVALKRGRTDKKSLRQNAGIDEHAFVYGVGSHAVMMGPQAWDMWMQMLRNRPGSLLWLHSENALVKAELRSRAAGAGIDPVRIRFADVLEEDGDKEWLAVPDVFVDSFPCSMGRRCLTPLAAGVPVLTCAPYSAHGYAAAVYLRAAGLDRWVVTSPDQLLALANEVAADNSASCQATEALVHAQRTSYLFNVPAAVASLEAELKRVVRGVVD